MLLKNLFLVMRYMGKNLLKGHSNMTIFAVMGCQAYLKGITYFQELDLEKQHQILQQAYKKLENKKKQNILFDWLMAGVQYIGLAVKMFFKYRSLKNNYQKNLYEITNMTFWMQKLEIEG